MTSMPVRAKFTDQQASAATGLGFDNLRRLITWKAVRPVQSGRGRGRVRLWTWDQVNRISIVAQLFDAGFSLRMAHTLALALPFGDLLEACEAESGGMDLDGAPFVTPPEALFCSRLVLINGAYLYAIDWDDVLVLQGFVDTESNRFFPRCNPREVAVRLKADGIDPEELLIHWPFYEGEDVDEALEELFGAAMMEVPAVAKLMCRRYLHIDLRLGLAEAHRKLAALAER